MLTSWCLATNPTLRLPSAGLRTTPASTGTQSLRCIHYSLAALLSFWAFSEQFLHTPRIILFILLHVCFLDDFATVKPNPTMEERESKEEKIREYSPFSQEPSFLGSMVYRDLVSFIIAKGFLTIDAVQ